MKMLFALMSVLVFAQAPKLDGPDDKLDLKDIQVYDARLESIQSRAALLSTQLADLQRQFDELSRKRKDKLSVLFKRHNIDPAQWKISNIETGELSAIGPAPRGGNDTPK